MNKARYLTYLRGELKLVNGDTFIAHKIVTFDEKPTKKAVKLKMSVFADLIMKKAPMGYDLEISELSSQMLLNLNAMEMASYAALLEKMVKDRGIENVGN